MARTFLKTIFFSLVAFSFNFGQKTELTNLLLESIEDSIKLVMEFHGLPPDYEVNTNKDNENNISIISFTLLKGTKSKKFDPLLFRPVQHIQVSPFKRDDAEGLFVIVYLKGPIDYNHRISGNTIEATFPGPLPAEPTTTPLIKLKNFSAEVKEELSISAVFTFSELPKKRSIFQTLDGKQVVMIFPNTDASKGIFKKIKSEIITKLESKSYKTLTGHSVQKVVFSSPYELLIDVAEESNQLFMEFYGMGQQGIEKISNKSQDDEEDYVYQDSQKSSFRWYYYLPIAGALIGGTVTGYYILSQGDDQDSNDEIPRPTIEFPRPQ